MHSDQSAVVGIDPMEALSPSPPPAPRHRHRVHPGAAPAPAPSGRWLTALAFTIVAVPFTYAIVRLATAPSAHLTLPDDLALIDLHVRRALAWKQQLGVFDHNNWNHPGPTYFYLLSLVYRVLGSSPRSMFVGATLLNAMAATACVAVVCRRVGPARALWAALGVCGLASVLAAGGVSATTYSESVLGALVSPWNPTVVLFPLLLLVLLCAGTFDRSGLSLVGAVLVASFVVQADVATVPLAVALLGGAGLVWVVTLLSDRFGGRVPPERTRASRWRARAMAVVGAVVLVLMWLPPVLQQMANHPGNLTLIYRFFMTGQSGQPLTAALWSVAAAFGVVVLGPGEIMRSVLGGAPAHAAAAVATSVVTVAVSVGLVAVGAVQRSRFALGIGGMVAVGCAATVVAVAHVVGFIFGYLVIWGAVLPVAALIGVGTVRLPSPAGWNGARTALRWALCAVAVAAGAVTCVRVAAIPSLARAGDPHVEQLAALVTARLGPGDRVAVGDADAGTKDSQLLDTEEFLGLVNLLDRTGYHPTANRVWRAELGPGFLTDGTEPRVVGLTTWTPDSPALPGYVGHVGDMAVTVTDRIGRPVPAAG